MKHGIVKSVYAPVHWWLQKLSLRVKILANVCRVFVYLQKVWEILCLLLNRFRIVRSVGVGGGANSGLMCQILTSGSHPITSSSSWAVPHLHWHCAPGVKWQSKVLLVSTVLNWLEIPFVLATTTTPSPLHLHHPPASLGLWPSTKASSPSPCKVLNTWAS